MKKTALEDLQKAGMAFGQNVTPEPGAEGVSEESSEEMGNETDEEVIEGEE